MSIWELLIVVIVGLLVIGPERLPGALRSGMLWFSRIKRTINDARTEFEQQLGVDEIRRELHNERVLESLRELEATQDRIKHTFNHMEDDLQQEIKHIENSIDDPVPHDDVTEPDNLDSEPPKNHE